MGEAGAMIKEVAATKERISEQMQESAKRGAYPKPRKAPLGGGGRGGGRLSRNRLTDPRQYGVRARGGKGQSSQRKARLCGAYGHKVGVRG